MAIELFFFYAFAFLAVFSAVAMVGFVRNVVAGAMSLVVTMISLAGIYVLLRAEFVAAIQIMVYAGAIVVVFLFVIMLLNLRADGFAPPRRGATLWKGVGAAGAVLVTAIFALRLPEVMPEAAEAPLPAGFGGYRAVGIALYTDYVVAVEIVGLILLAAIVGAVVLAKRKID
jgi:NADH-quinone oxidoreductase subunit J